MTQFGMVFPGQGSQSVGMAGALAESRPVVRQVFEECSEALGYDLWQLTAEGPEDKLNQTEFTQPALLAAGVATWRCWEEVNGPRPQFMAGHSLGEYTALVCAGAMGLADTAKLVAARGRFMTEAVGSGEGLMAAIIGLELDALTSVCADAANGEVVSPANLNAPGQIVIAGNRAAVERAIDKATTAGAKRAITLAVSAPSHCALMIPAAEALAAELANVEVRMPSIPVVQNADAAVAEDVAKLTDALLRQLHHPVRWIECVEFMAGKGVEALVECGPGKVLTGMTRRINRALSGMAIGSEEDLERACAQLGANQ